MILPVRIDHAKEVHIQDANKDEKHDHGRVHHVHDRFVALGKIRGVDVPELALFVDVIAGLLPRLLLIDLGKRTVHPVDVLEEGADHVAVEENFALELGVVEEHQDEGNGADAVCSQSERLKVFKLLQNAN